MGKVNGLITGVALILVFAVSPLPDAKRTLADGVDSKNVDIVVLVDESTSLSQTDVQSERDAVLNIIGTPVLFDQSIRVQILPFSSGPRSPRTLPECALTELDAAGAQFLSESCVPQIRRETSDDGLDGAGNTNFESAIRGALQVLERDSDPSRRQAILLLTDGKYDPSGSGLPPNVFENDALDSALQLAREREVQVWPLGFGEQVAFDALLDYASKGYQGEKNCPPPTPLIVNVSTLSTEIYEVLEDMICVEIPPPNPTPGVIRVHPFVDLLTIDVLSSAEEPVLRDPDGSIVCDGNWIRVRSSFRCQLRLDGSNPGIWLIFGSPGSAFLFQSSGSVDISLSKCDDRPVLRVSRTDGKKTNWDFEPPAGANWELAWPKVQITYTDESGSAISNKVEVELSSEEVAVPAFASAKSISAELAEDSPTDGISINAIAECQTYSVATTTSTPFSQTDVDLVSETDDQNGDQPPSSPMWWLILAVTVLLAIGIGVGLRRRHKARRFPNGTIIKQLNPNTKVMLEIPDIDLAGARKVGLQKPSQGWRVQVCDVTEADIVLSRDGSEVIVQELAGEDALASEELDNSNSRFPLNDRFRVGSFEFIIEVPEDFYEYTEEDEQ
jgi:hypothetical protein